MSNISKKIKVITTALLCMAFIMHIGILIHNRLNPALPEVRYYKKSLDKIDFPIAFQICISEKKDYTKKYWDLGYMDLWEFFLGYSRFNESVVGWAGHTENGSSIGSVEEILQKISHNWSNIVTDIWLYTSDLDLYTISGTDLNWTPVFQYPLCQTLNLNEYFDLNEYTQKELQIYFGSVENVGIAIDLIEQNKVSTRTLRNNYLSYTGPSLAISDLFHEKGRQIEIIVQLSQNIKTESDEESKCRNYPNKEYLSYNDCDQTYVHRVIQEKFNITPFWVTQDLNNVTTISYQINPEIDNLDFFFEGSTESPCYIPCLNTKIKGSLVSSKQWKNDYDNDYETGIFITFDQTVSITESFYPSLSISNLFSDMGGSIGLWLGIGLLQICFYLVDFINWINSVVLTSNKINLKKK